MNSGKEEDCYAHIECYRKLFCITSRQVSSTVTFNSRAHTLNISHRLFDERLAQYNEELAMLEQPTFIHPGLFLMKEVVDQRRNQKVKYEQTLLKLKLESLQRESIANKAQIHSQYMQTVGDLRDNFLSQINAEIYQTQRERRSCEADMPDYMYAFNAKRSKQIMDQTAYNEEVSLLSGVAKYVGFPAAPKIAKARSNEWEEDERAYKHKFVVSLFAKRKQVGLGADED